MALLLSLPPELLIIVLVNLDWRDLLRCLQVCRFLRDYINNDVSMQYKIELAVAGMEDGPPSLLTPSDRLRMLQERQTAWRSLQWKSSQDYPISDKVWELYGGVLAQANQEGLLTVTQLPSVIRGVEEKQWKVPDMGIDIRDFSMDPAQDLLVVVENVVSGHVMHCRVHLRSLQTGAIHPAAMGGILERSPLNVMHCTYTIQTSDNLLGLLVGGDEEHELLIWDWQAGALRMHLKGPEIPAFAFLSSRYMILLPNYPDVDPLADDVLGEDGICRIIVIDLDATLPQPTSLQDVPYVCALLYPKLARASVLLSITIRSDPAPRWRPHATLKVPFCTSRADRLFVITLQLIEGPLLSFVPAATILAAIATLGPTAARAVVPWAAWGPAGSRFLYAPWMRPTVWVCYVYGMRFAMVRPAGAGAKQVVSVLDFNQLAARRALATDVAGGQDEHGDGDGDGGGERVAAWLLTAPTVWEVGRFFVDEVVTWLPYYWHQKKMTVGREGEEHQCTAAMLSEDSLILVSSKSHVEKYHVLTF